MLLLRHAIFTLQYYTLIKGRDTPYFSFFGELFISEKVGFLQSHFFHSLKKVPPNVLFYSHRYKICALVVNVLVKPFHRTLNEITRIIACNNIAKTPFVKMLLNEVSRQFDRLEQQRTGITYLTQNTGSNPETPHYSKLRSLHPSSPCCDISDRVYGRVSVIVLNSQYGSPCKSIHDCRDDMLHGNSCIGIPYSSRGNRRYEQYAGEG